MVDNTASCRSFLPARLWVPVGLGAILLYCYLPTLGEAVRRWHSDPQYSHGYLVPVFAVALLWLRRRSLASCSWQLSWWGVALLGAGAVMHVAGAYFYFDWLDGFSLVPSLAGLCVLVGGGCALEWAGPAIGFLVFMIPLPFRVETALSQPLQPLATRASTYTLETLGYPAISEGNIILLEGNRIGVFEACSGLGMLVTFFAMTTGMALVVRRPLFDKLVIVVSAIPIALLANVARIVVTAMLLETSGSADAFAFFHDGAGWFMMPLALGILWLELRILSTLLQESRPPAPLRIDLKAYVALPKRACGPVVEAPALR
jgi:exosortase